MISDICERCKHTGCKWKKSFNIKECNQFMETEDEHNKK